MPESFVRREITRVARAAVFGVGVACDVTRVACAGGDQGLREPRACGSPGPAGARACGSPGPAGARAAHTREG